jgi:hypothetical protein
MYPAGTHIPRHTHTDETLKFILKGHVKFDDGEVKDVMAYKCDYSHGYGGDALEDTYMLLLQKPGTTTKPA